MESLERLQGLHEDLVAFTEKKLATIDRLLFELEATLSDFRQLLDKPQPTEKDKEAYKNGKVILGEGESLQEYAINEEFKHISTALSTAVDLNEVEAAKILVRDYGDTVAPSLSFIAKAVANYQDGRDLLMQSLRLVLQHADDIELEEELRLDIFQRTVREILQTRQHPDNGSRFIEKCLTGLQGLENQYNSICNQLQNRETVGQLAGPERDAILTFQKKSLFKQHEALSCVVAYLFRGGYSNTGDVHKLSNAAQRWTRPDILLVHCLPAFSAAFRQYGSAEHTSTFESSRNFNAVFGTIPRSDRASTLLDPFLAILRIWWTVEYSSLFGPGREDEPEAKLCPEQLKHGLKEQGLQLLLAICSSMTASEWRHPARQEMVSHLMRNAPDFNIDGEQSSDYFRIMIMESVETFAESFISNMPDTIRQVKNEEDDIRLEQIAAIQEGNQSDPKNERPLPLYLEAFLILISFAFEHRSDASEQWWEDTESNLYGFLQWTSKRQTVPRVSAFCDMLCSIAEGSEGAEAAHTFLLEDAVPAAIARSRRIPSMNYAQMLAELDLYSRKVHERAATSTLANRKILETEMNESESPIMLSSYLRLIAHLCRHSDRARDFIFGHPTFDVPRILLLLSSGPVPSFLRASVYATLDAMVTDKTWQRSSDIWLRIDEWASNGNELIKATLAKTDAAAAPTMSALQTSLASIAASPDQYDAFVSLLRALLVPVFPENNPTFPEALGSAYRTAGIGPYIDFICGQIFSKRLQENNDRPQALLCTYHCLDAIAQGLGSFDNARAALYNRALAKNTSASIVMYFQRHPYARLMQWLLSTEMDKPLMRIFRTSQQDVAGASSTSPLVQSIQRTIDVLNIALTSQATYIDVVKPVLKDSIYERSLAGQTSIEEHILAHPEIILELCQYSASEHLELALKALSLLQKLSSSAKLNNHFLSQTVFKDRSRRMIDLLGPNATTILASVSETLATKLQVSERELEGGFESAGYLFKDGVIAFLNACLETQPELANIAHILLGFRRLGERLILSEESQKSINLFDGLIMLVRDYPHGDNSGFVSWLTHIKSASMQVLRQLWTSPVSADITLTQLRRYQLLKALIATQEAVAESSRWDERTLFDADFWFSQSAEAMTELLEFRGALYHYASEEIRAASAQGLTAVLKQHLQTMLGNDIAGTPLGHANVFDLADFLELDLSLNIGVPETQYFATFEPDSFMSAPTDDKPSLYDVALVKEALNRDRDELLSRVQPPSSSSTQVDADQAVFEVEVIAVHCEARNRLFLARQAWRATLRSYVDMVIALVECCSMEPSTKTQFILQILQLILPKFDALVAQESEDTIELARIADGLLFALSTINKLDIVRDGPAAQTPTIEQDRIKQERLDSIITEKLFQLFRASVDGILMANGAPGQRGILYSICSQYLTRITGGSKDNDTNRKARSNSMDCIRSSNMRLINILSDDAEDGADSSRLNALGLLALLCTLSNSEKSSYVLDSLVKANVLEIIIDPMKNIATDFQDTAPSLRHHILTLFEARMLLLLQLSRTRPGAGAILDAGFISAVRDSLLFRADPDLGFSLPASTTANNNNYAQPFAILTSSTTSSPAAIATALQTYYALLAPTLRVLLSVFTSRGAQNEQAVFLARQFLSDNRANMVGVFKKFRGVSGKVDRRSERLLGEVVRCYTGLCVLCGWVEYEDGEGVGGGGNGDVRMGGGGGDMGLVGGGTGRRGYGFS